MAKKVKMDDDAPEITAQMFAKMRPMKKADPGMVRAIKASRGRPRVENPKAVVSVRLSAPAKQAWDALPTDKRAEIIAAMERSAVRAAAR